VTYAASATIVARADRLTGVTVDPCRAGARWKEDKVGAWLYHCHVEGHMDERHVGLYVVSK